MYYLPLLDYNYGDLEPTIDAKTVEIHHSKHHQAYIDKLNQLLEKYTEFQDLELSELIQNIGKLPENIKTLVFNNAGQVYNHNLYWDSIIPKGSELDKNSELYKQIEQKFGNLTNFNQELIQLGLAQFGSGWVWLSLDEKKELILDKTSNADSPLTKNHFPLLTIDVWEHAYYLGYQNLRAKYLENIIAILDWQKILERYLIFTK